MLSRELNIKQPGMASPSRISALLISLVAAVASLYIAGRLWEDAESRNYLVEEVGKGKENVGLHIQREKALSLDESYKILGCREHQKKLLALEMELAAAAQAGFVSKNLPVTKAAHSNKKPLLVVGIFTGFDRKNTRDAIRSGWLGTDAALKRLEVEKGIIARFVIGRSSSLGDALDMAIDRENYQTNDFIILGNHEEAPEKLPEKAKEFFAYAADNWAADFYIKVNDNVYVDVDELGTTLAAHLNKPRVYIGCMKSGKVLDQPGTEWYEPDWWKFGDGKSYFRHASTEIYVISQALARFISINRSIIRTYANDDVSVGSWFIGLDVKHVNEGSLCCSYGLPGTICVTF